MRLGFKADNLLERVANWFNLAPMPIVQVFFGMMSSRTMMAGVKLGVYAALAEGPATAEALAERLKLSPEGTRALLEGLVSCEVVKRRRDRYHLDDRARRWLDPRSPQYIGGFIEFNYAQWDWWSQLEETVRSGKAVDIHGFAPEDPRWKDYIHAMHQLARLAAPEVASAIPLPRGAKHVLDLGGAHGWFAAELWRLRGETLLRAKVRDPTRAEECFRRAIGVARHQGARWWELRAAASLARLWAEQGERRQALDLLAPVYSGLTEGLDMPDLRDARALLERLR